MKFCFVLLLLIVSFGKVDAQENRNGFRLDTIYRFGAKRQVVKAPVKKSVPLKTSMIRKAGKWTLGGSCGVSFGDYTSVDVSPQVGYWWNEFFSAGGGVNYNYHHSSNQYDMNYLGVNVFGRVNPVRYIALQIQPELKGSWGKSYGKKIDFRYVPTMLVGGGGVIPTGTGSISVMFYYDVIQDECSPYGKNWVCSVGYSFNL